MNESHTRQNPDFCNPQSPKCCTPPEGSTTILTVEAPGGLAINLLGIHIDVCPLCIAVYADDELTPQQTEVVNKLLQALQAFIQSDSNA